MPKFSAICALFLWSHPLKVICRILGTLNSPWGCEEKGMGVGRGGRDLNVPICRLGPCTPNLPAVTRTREVSLMLLSWQAGGPRVAV